MIEILVCLFILSIAVICAAGLLLQSSRMSRHAAQASAAAMLAGELAEHLRMRQERQPGWSGPPESSAASAQSAAPEGDDSGLPLDLHIDDPAMAATAGAAGCFVSDCSIEEMDRFALHDWTRRLVSILPGARVVACHDAAPWNAAANRYQWACTAAATGSAPLLVKLGWHSPMTAPGAAWPLLVVPVQ
ncbi:hypothetical protein [Lacisediminimonas sp.]|uniref:hypothetical protein n=1 Tax=Lacisediminimonas sp. TaxID=3060582 RepID=UPI0027190C5B|nr:hypothetical protein [Lacisediminimonas sp.]MDO8299122.1 hypothetical protein [Lacisediminimonas sp.]